MYMPLDRQTQPPAILFVIDITEQSLSANVLPSVAACLSATLSALPENYPGRVGFITYGSAVHFWDLLVRCEQHNSFDIVSHLKKVRK